MSNETNGLNRLSGKVAIVIGAGSIGPGWGNGKATAVKFAREGAIVHLVDHDSIALQETVAIIHNEGNHCTSHVADISNARQISDAIEACHAQHGRIDVLHNNVGIVSAGTALDINMDEWDRAFSVNLSGIVHACKTAVPYMARQKSGSIINVSSISSLRVLSGLSYISYPASKAALNHLTHVMAVEFAPDQIRCNAILPGFIHTPMIESSVLASLSKGKSKTLNEYLYERTARIPMARWGDAWDIANAAVFLASDESRYITGLELVVDGGATLVAG